MRELTVIAGPCAMESYNLMLEVADQMNNLCGEFGFNYVSSLHSVRQIGQAKIPIVVRVSNRVESGFFASEMKLGLEPQLTFTKYGR